MRVFLDPQLASLRARMVLPGFVESVFVRSLEGAKILCPCAGWCSYAAACVSSDAASGMEASRMII